jgi:hypothetical protein
MRVLETGTFRERIGSGLTGLALFAAALLLTGCTMDRPGGPATDARPAGSRAAEVDCGGGEPDTKRVYWGDLHVHTAYSLDAYGYGTIQTPADAFRFAKGQRIDLPSGPVQLARPLDFMAVTDHAEWLDLMFTCTEPGFSSHPVCRNLRAKSSQATGSSIFKELVNPTITGPKPEPTELCKDDPKACIAARDNQWARAQRHANEANQPCRFTAFIGFEWSATPGASHTHRNVIFANEHATAFPIDYIRYPRVSELWDALVRQCRPEDGCDAIAIPHNMNMGDGLSFDVETEDERELALRTRYERLVEVTQEKGSSECLAPYGDRLNSKDCAFEAYITSHSQPKALQDFSEAEWERMRGSYARGLLRRGLLARARTGQNPLQVGFVGSTDTHTGLGGFVDEAQWQGSVFGMGDFQRNMGRLGFNPGGIVGVWAEQNTRESLFAALKRREVYATSGPRIALRFHASAGPGGLSCEGPAPGSRTGKAVPMGGMLNAAGRSPEFRIEATADKAPIARIEIVKGETRKGDFRETVETVWSREGGGTHACVIWKDKAFDRGEGVFWYPRVIEVPTPRWSAVHCRREGKCAEFPGADRTIEERAWGSPIWYAPG